MTFISNTLIIPVDNSIDRCYIYNMMRNTRNTKTEDKMTRTKKEIRTQYEKTYNEKLPRGAMTVLSHGAGSYTLCFAGGVEISVRRSVVEY
jgi:hypothetical protein